MLTPQEDAFIRYWEENRSRKKKVFRQFLVGIPVGLAFAIPIVINFASGWDVQATATGAATDKGLIMVLMVALLLIVGFIAIFYQKYKWDQYEQRYRELLNKRGAARD
jgi:hypothetical protein